MTEMKKCRDCGLEKSVEDFHLVGRESAKELRRNTCKSCHAKRAKARRAAHIDAAREYDRAYYEQHREAVKLDKRRRREERAAAAGRPYITLAEAQRRQRPESKQKRYARTILQKAVARGKLARPDRCSQCHRRAPDPIEGHHPDYMKPLDIEWLCKDCHEELHHGEHERTA